LAPDASQTKLISPDVDRAAENKDIIPTGSDGTE